MERLRGGGALLFSIDVRMLVRSDVRGTQRGFEKLLFEANLSGWSTVLQQLGYLELLLIGVELPIGAPQEFKKAVEQVRAAQLDLIAGRYDSTVGRCRIAMDAVEALVSYESVPADVRQTFAAKKEIREAMTKRARADLIRMAIRHYTHLAHHVDVNGMPESFSRQDALFILTAAAGAIWDAAAELRRRA